MSHIVKSPIEQEFALSEQAPAIDTPKPPPISHAKETPTITLESQPSSTLAAQEPPPLDSSEVIARPPEESTAQPPNTTYRDVPSPPTQTASPDTSPSRTATWEQLWQKLGFILYEDGVWRHPQTGERLQRDRHNAYQWARFAPDGQAVAYYWGGRYTKTNGLEMPYETWRWFEEHPQQTFLILWNANSPEILSGADLLEKIERGAVRVFPAVYRLQIIEDF